MTKIVEIGKEYVSGQQSQYRQDSKKDWTGYRRGQEAGADVGLDKQVGACSTNKLT